MAHQTADAQPFRPVRAISIGAMLLILGSFWIIVQELLLDAGSLSANAPPVGAVGLFAALLSVSISLGWLRRRWQLGRRELLVIYCMLVSFFPLASEGLWHRFVGILISVRQFYEAQVPAHMIPGGPELLQNNRFTDGLNHFSGTAQAHTYHHKQTTLAAALLANDQADGMCDLIQRVKRRDGDGRDRFAPGQKFNILIYGKWQDLVPGSWFSLAMSLDGQVWRNLRMTRSTDSFADTADGTGLELMRNYNVEIPPLVEDELYLRWRLAGKGQVTITSISFHSNEPIQRLIEGSSELSGQYENQVDRAEKGRLFFRPEGRWQRMLYDLRGPIPWRSWASPLLGWGLLWVAMFLGMYSLGAILFKQWSDREKLTFPLTAVPMLLTEPDQTRSVVPRIFRARPMWAGLVTAVALYTLNGLHFYNADFPGIPLFIDLGRHLIKAPFTALTGDGNVLALRIVLLGVGVAFFMDLQMSLSLWVFFVLCKLYLLVPYYQGTLEPRMWARGPSYGRCLWEFQGVGAAIGVVICTLWLGRNHLREVFGAVIRRIPPGSSTSLEPMPYRWAVVGLLGSLVLLGLWGHIAGAGWLFGVLGMGGMLLLAVMAARVRAECAAPGMWLVPSLPFVFVSALGGMSLFGVLPVTYVMLTANFMCAGFFLMLMPSLMDSFQVAKLAGIGRGVMGAAMVVGFLVAVVAGGYLLLTWGYSRGLSTMRGSVTMTDDYSSVLWYWRVETEERDYEVMVRGEVERLAANEHQLDEEDANLLAKYRHRAGVDRLARNRALGFAGAGAAITCLLTYIRLTFLQFPLHPLGYALATSPLMSYFWFSIFLAWLIRTVALRLGGVRVIRAHLQPYMIGLILGSVAAVLIWDAVAIYKVAGGYTGEIYVTW